MEVLPPSPWLQVTAAMSRISLKSEAGLAASLSVIKISLEQVPDAMLEDLAKVKVEGGSSAIRSAY